MNLTRCSQGHFYDADTNKSCPHCQKSTGNDETVAINRVVEEEIKTVPLTGAMGGGNQEKTTKGGDATQKLNSLDDGVTIRFTPNVSSDKEPVVGWLVCIEGTHLGEDFRLSTGNNFIGRGNDMQVSLARDKSVSRSKHAVVLYDPKTYTFLVYPGESRELCYLNDKVVVSAQELKRNDIITLGDSKLMFFPCCDAKFNWGMTSKGEEKAEEKSEN